MKNKLIAIVGSIGSGKSTVGKYLQSLGFCVLDCDQIARDVASLPDVVESVGQLLGKEYIADGKLDRRAIRMRIFGDHAILSKYNAIFLKRISHLLMQKISSASSLNKVIFVEMNFSNFFDIGFHQIWEIVCCPQLQVERVQARDNVSAENVYNMLNLKRAEFSPTLVIENTSNLQQLFESIDRAVSMLG